MKLWPIIILLMAHLTVWGQLEQSQRLEFKVKKCFFL